MIWMHPWWETNHKKRRKNNEHVEADSMTDDPVIRYGKMGRDGGPPLFFWIDRNITTAATKQQGPDDDDDDDESQRLFSFSSSFTSWCPCIITRARARTF